MTTAVLHRINRVLAVLGESGVDALLANMTLMQYCVQDMFKGRQVPNIARNVAKKFSGGTNMFLGPGVITIDPKELEAALWRYLGQEVARASGKVLAGKEHYAIDGTMTRFYIKPQYRERLKKAAIGEIGRDVFVNDGVAESVSTEAALTFPDKRSRNRADDAVLSVFHDDVVAGRLSTRQRHAEPTVLYVSGAKRTAAVALLTSRKFTFTQGASEGVNWHQTFTDGFVAILEGALRVGQSVDIPKYDALSGRKNYGSGSGEIVRLTPKFVTIRKKNDEFMAKMFGPTTDVKVPREYFNESLTEMAATYVPITRDEFEAWLTEVWGSGNWNIRSGSVGVYRLKLSPKVSLEVSSSIGRADTNMSVGEGAIHVAMVGRVTGRTLNKKATGKSRINRTKGWKGNLLAALKALEAAYNASPAFYDSIADPQAYRDETLARIASIPGSATDVFWSSLRDQVSAGRVLSDKQTAVLMRRTPDFQFSR